MRFFEDIVLGERVELGKHTFTAQDIKAFAESYDPQLFHLDQEAAARSHFGALCASGWHTAAVWMKLFVAYKHRLADEMRARGEPVARHGPSPGFRELKWLKPVYAGDVISFATEPIDKRESKSRPEWGLMFSRNTGTNQAGDLVFSFISSAFIERRPG